MMRLDRLNIAELEAQLDQFEGENAGLAEFLAGLSETGKANFRTNLQSAINHKSLTGRILNNLKGRNEAEYFPASLASSVHTYIDGIKEALAIDNRDELTRDDAKRLAKENAKCQAWLVYQKALICAELFDDAGEIKPAIYLLLNIDGKLDEVVKGDKQQLKKALISGYATNFFPVINSSGDSIVDTIMFTLPTEWTSDLGMIDSNFVANAFAALPEHVRESDFSEIKRVQSELAFMKKKLAIKLKQVTYNKHEVLVSGITLLQLVNAEQNKGIDGDKKLISLLDQLLQQFYGKNISQNIADNETVKIKQIARKAKELGNLVNPVILIGEKYKQKVEITKNTTLLELKSRDYSPCDQRTELEGLEAIQYDCFRRQDIQVNGKYVMSMFRVIYGIEQDDFLNGRFNQIAEKDVEKILVPCCEKFESDCIKCRVKMDLEDELDGELKGEAHVNAIKIIIDRKWDEYTENILSIDNSVAVDRPNEGLVAKEYKNHLRMEFAKEKIVSIVNRNVTLSQIKEQLESDFGAQVAGQLIGFYSQNLQNLVGNVLNSGIEDFDPVKTISWKFSKESSIHFGREGDYATMKFIAPSIYIRAMVNGEMKEIVDTKARLEVEFRVVQKAEELKLEMSRVICEDPVIRNIFRGVKCTEADILEHYDAFCDYFKENEYTLVLKQFKTVIESYPEGNLMYKSGAKIFNDIKNAYDTPEKSERLSQEKKRVLIDAMKSSARLMKNPCDQAAQEAILGCANKIRKYRGGKQVAGGLSALAGVAMMATSVALGVVSFGITSPLSIAMFSAGFVLATGGITTAKSAYFAHTLFGPRKEASVVSSMHRLVNAI